MNRMMRVKSSVEMFGHTFEVLQADAGDAVILRVDDVYLVGEADASTNLVLPHHLIVTNNPAAAEEIAEFSNRTGVSVQQMSKHLAHHRNGGDAA